MNPNRLSLSITEAVGSSSQVDEVHFEDIDELEYVRPNRRYFPLNTKLKGRAHMKHITKNLQRDTIGHDKSASEANTPDYNVLPLIGNVITGAELEDVPGPSHDNYSDIIQRYKILKGISSETDNVQVNRLENLNWDSDCDFNMLNTVDVTIAPISEQVQCVPIIKLKRVFRQTRSATDNWQIIPQCKKYIKTLKRHSNNDTHINRPLAMCHQESFNPNIVQKHSLGHMSIKCKFCGALKFKGESENLCCAKGLIKLPQFVTPVPEIVALYKDKEFLKNIRAYNSVFGFTSVGATTTTDLRLDTNLANARQGVYTFRIQGTMCHRMGSLLPPGDNQIPSFAQIYIMDPCLDNRSARRCDIMDGLNLSVVQIIERAMASHNPYAKAYSSVGLEINSNPDVIGLRIFESVNTDLRRYNSPTSSEVAAIIVGDLEDKPRDLIVYKKKGGMVRVFDTGPSYDPLQYPLLFPRGELGWQTYLLYGNGNKRHGNQYISTREFYAYR